MSDRDEIRRLAEQLLIIADGGELGPGASDHSEHANAGIIHADPDVLGQVALSHYRARRLRDRYFDSVLFAEPAWDMLLDLYVQKQRGNRVSIKAMCAASHVPDTTALRWIDLLLEGGLIVRERDETDRRRIFVRLSPAGLKALSGYLIEARRLLRPKSGAPIFLLQGGVR